VGSDEVSNIGAVPVAHDEKIVGFSKCIQAPAEAYIEIIEVVSLASNLICHALYNEKKVLRSVRQFPHDEIDMLFMPSTHCDVCAQCQARN